MTKTVIETALDEELSEHLGYDRHDPAGHGSGNSRNGTRSKAVLTDSCGSVEIEVPRDRAGTFEPHLVKKRQRRLTDVDEVIFGRGGQPWIPHRNGRSLSCPATAPIWTLDSCRHVLRSLR